MSNTIGFSASTLLCSLSRNSNVLTKGHVLLVHNYACLINLAKLCKLLGKKTIFPLTIAHMGVWQPHMIAHHDFQHTGHLNINNNN